MNSVIITTTCPRCSNAAALTPARRACACCLSWCARFKASRAISASTAAAWWWAQPLDEIVPLEPATMPGRVVIQWDKDDCADLGIIKIDLLGLGMLAVLEQALPLIREHEGIELDLARLPPDDPAVYEMLCQADTVGIFQVESRAQMAILPRRSRGAFMT